ncbi:flagellar biosynthetic protein FliO [Sediminibacillus massiliensis]|uniref:flagellar biosynthetic protein FliO n=1 Tax=Sediminibacillus massiliensis TaxID=1926277 RepID=UPI0015C2DC81|nr:flagellar biosynthetic protein FliO [Sediminibacillus massiliensis]
MKRLFIQIILVFTVGLAATSYQVSAAAPNVDDCLGSDMEECVPGSEQEQPAQSDDRPLADSESGQSLFISFLKLGVSLAFVLALIYFLLKFVNRRNKMFQKVRALENLGGISLGSQKSLQAVRIGDRVYVIGVGDNVELLSEITDEKTKNDLLKQETTELNPANFVTALINKKPGNQKESNFSDIYKKELDRINLARKKMIERHQSKEDDRNE